MWLFGSHLFQIGSISAIYILAGQFGLALRGPDSISPFWLPSGLALAVLLIFGSKIWPAILIGSLSVTLYSFGSAPASLIITGGNLAEAFLANFLLVRVAGFQIDLRRKRDVLALIFCASILSTSIGATSAAVASALGFLNLNDHYEPLRLGLAFWLNRMASVLTITPLILTWSSPCYFKHHLKRHFSSVLELSLFCLTASAFGYFVFMGTPYFNTRQYPILLYMSCALIVWAAFRFELRGLSSLFIFFYACSILGTKSGYGIFAAKTELDTILQLQMYVLITLPTSLFLGAAITERTLGAQAIKAYQAELEAKILERTEKLNLARAEAEKANRAKDIFLATVSHELRTPLTTLIAWTQLLRLKKLKDSEEIYRAIEKIEECAFAQEHLIQDLLDISRIATGKFSPDFRSIDLADTVKKAVESIRPLAEKSCLRLHIEFKTEIKPIQADPDRLRQVIWNLLNNSIKFTPQKGQINVRVSKKKKVICITVADSGRGIPREFLPHIFEQFSQTQSATKMKNRGLGLGLSICKNIVEMHRGRIRAFSGGPGNGTVICIILPIHLETKSHAA